MCILVPVVTCLLFMMLETLASSFFPLKSRLTLRFGYFKKNAGWATDLSAGEGDGTTEFSFFTVVINLTDAGHG